MIHKFYSDYLKADVLRYQSLCFGEWETTLALEDEVESLGLFSACNLLGLLYRQELAYKLDKRMTQRIR